MNTTFRIRKTLGEVWDLFMEHVWFFGAVAAVAVVLNMIGSNARIPGLIRLILLIASILWSIVVLKVSLAAADGKKDLFSFHRVKELFPDWTTVLGFFGVMLCTFGAFFVGAVLVTLYLVLGVFSGPAGAAILGLIVLPFLIFIISLLGAWIAVRLSLASFIYIDTKQSIRQSLKSSYAMTGGSTFWTTVLVCLVFGALYVVGVMLFNVGLVVTYPVAMIFLARYYRALGGHKDVSAASSTVVVQATEIEAPHHEGEMS